MTEWISVNDELPEGNEIVIAVTKLDIIPAIYTYFDPNFYFRPHGITVKVDDFILVEDVTHWMSLPEPPK